MAAVTADFDADGIPDLAAIYRVAEGEGIVALHGVDPGSPAYEGSAVAARFAGGAHIARLAIAPEFAVAGDVDADGNADLIVGTGGGTRLATSEGTAAAASPAKPRSHSADRSPRSRPRTSTVRTGSISSRPSNPRTARRIPRLQINVRCAQRNARADSASRAPGRRGGRFSRRRVQRHRRRPSAPSSSSSTGAIASCTLLERWSRLRRSHGSRFARRRFPWRRGAGSPPKTESSTWRSCRSTAGSTIRRSQSKRRRSLLFVSRSIAGPSARVASAVLRGGRGGRPLVIDPDAGRLLVYATDPATTTGLTLVRELPIVAGPSAVVPLRRDRAGLDRIAVLDGARGDLATPDEPLSTLVVSSTGDTADATPGDGVCNDGTGNCTLRAAIQEANALAGADSITFALGAGSPTISSATALPDITSPVTIQGNTAGRPASRSTERRLPGNAERRKLAAGSSGSLIRSLVINRVAGTGAGLRIESASDTVEDCWIGLDASGSTSVSGNAGGGVVISGAGATNNLIGGTAAGTRNVVSHNGAAGITIDAGASGNTCKGTTSEPARVRTSPSATRPTASSSRAPRRAT